MKDDPKIEDWSDVTEEETTEREDWEFEYANEIVEEFLEKAIIPALYAFDFQNEDEHYIPGLALYTLFAKIVTMLGDQGWTEDQLTSAISEFLLISDDHSDHTLH